MKKWYIYIYSSQLYLSGSKKFIKVVLNQERILVWGFRTTLMKSFDPLQMLTSVYIYIYIYIAEVGSNELHLLPYIYLSNFLGN